MPIRRGYADWVHGQIHYRVCGAGEPIVLLSGAPRSGGQMAPLAEVLAAQGFQVIAPDMPGFGQSDAVLAVTGMAGIAAFLAPLLDSLGVRCAHLFGLHSGAKIAASFAAAFPECAASVIAAGKSHSLVPDREARNSAMMAVVRERYFTGGADRVDGPDALQGWAAAWRNLTKAWWDDALFMGEDPETVIRGIEEKIIDDLTARRTVQDFYAANFAGDFAGDLARVKAPVLIVEITSETEDRNPGRQAAALAERAGNAQIAELPQIGGPGHLLPAKLEAIASTIARFVRQHPVSPDVR